MSFTDSGNIQNVIGELSKKRDITLTISSEFTENVSVMADYVRLNQIFINLLSNAVKFTPHGGKVSLSIERSMSKDGKEELKRFIVSDNGIGMSKEFIPHAYESFNQEYRNNTSERTQGTGLGLAIVKELVNLMDGTIKLQSKLNVGTTFTVDLPLKEITLEASKVQSTKETYAKLHHKHILLAEDNDINREIATVLLKKYECDVECAENGKIACDKFSTSEPGYYSAILMDIRMPIMDGLTAARRIRTMKHPDAKKVPIIAMTADAFNEDERIAYDAGMNAHVPKPFEPHVLYETCCKYIT